VHKTSSFGFHSRQVVAHFFLLASEWSARAPQGRKRRDGVTPTYPLARTALSLASSLAQELSAARARMRPPFCACQPPPLWRNCGRKIIKNVAVAMELSLWRENVAVARLKCRCGEAMSLWRKFHVAVACHKDERVLD
jgi:hypothetical protein